VDSLSGGQRKLLDFGMSIISDPDLILLDEPTAGVNPTLINELTDRIHDLNDRGMTFLIVEHNMDVVMDLADSIIVLNEGQVLMRDEPAVVQGSEEVIDAYFGTGKIEQ
jgi:branched-chain amino acid transport system ATP-binding protein